ncbi:MAG: YbaK/EbsC family protein [Ilumatobacteraceae bacterium]
MDPIERAVRDTVAGLDGVEVIDCDPELADTAAFCEAYGYSPTTRPTRSWSPARRSRPCTPCASSCRRTRLDVNKVVRKRLGTRKASFAPADDTVTLTGMTPGGVTPFALPARRAGVG